MKLTHVIYKLTFPNGKIYIGQTCNFRQRMWQHKGCSFNFTKKDSEFPVAFAIRKYGWENVQKEVIQRCTEGRINFWERKLIKELKANNRKFGYNIALGGKSGKTVSEETRKKQSLRLFEDYRTGKRVAPWKGKEMPKSFREGAVRCNIGNSNNPLVKKFGSENLNAIKVLQLDSISNKVVKEWGCIKDAGESLLIDRSSITKVCKKKRKIAGGFGWRYKNEV